MAQSTEGQAGGTAALTECSLCLETFTKPKCLPCIHTFCLTCLSTYVEMNTETEEEKEYVKLPCPLCRKEFSIPPEGLNELPNNFFISNIVELEKSILGQMKNKGVDAKCEECLQLKNEGNYPSAINYCPECKQDLCHSCTTSHAIRMATKSHKVVLLREKAKAIENSIKNRARDCIKHKGNPVLVYCVKCDMAVCMICLSVDHVGHACVEIEKASEDYRKQFSTRIPELRKASRKGESKIKELQIMEEGIKRESVDNEKKIKERCNDLRKMIEIYEDELLNEARKFGDEKIKDLKMKLEDVRFQNTEVESLTMYIEEMIKKGSNSDLVCDGKELKLRAEHLQARCDEVFSADYKLDHLEFQRNELKLERNQLGRFITDKKFLITIGLYTGGTVEQKMCRISLDNPDTITVINSTPAHIDPESAACVINNNLYAVGIGEDDNEMWAWSAERDEWTRRAKMTSGRRRHCVTSVGEKIYALGGWDDEDERTLDSILRYDIKSNTWTEAGKLCHAVMNVTCVTYKDCIYVFGGSDKDGKNVNHVQVYNTVASTISLSSNPMPAALRLMRAVLWRSKALLIGYYTCYIYDFESGKWLNREKFKTGVVNFGLTVDDDKLYISGGGYCSKDANNEVVWTLRDDVMSLSVGDLVSDNAEAKWKHHAKLPEPATISLYSPVAMLK